MRPKTALPPIDDDLAGPPRPRLDLRALAPRQPIDEAQVDANSRALGARWGASTSLDPQTAPVAPAPSVPFASLRLEVPAYLDQALTVKAAEQRVTKAFLVMTALAQAGYPVEPSDLVPDRRKTRGRAG
jgi:hypothetical protein